MIDLNRHLSGDRSLLYNRLFIIGNGFDLAMGLKSSYNDFIRYYFNHLLVSSLKSSGSNLEHFIKYNCFEDELFVVGLKDSKGNPIIVLNQLLREINGVSFKDYINKITNHKDFRLVPKGAFVKQLLEQINTENWVDIELLYFDMLHEFKTKKDKVLQFNRQLDFLKKELINYLGRTESSINIDENLKKSINEVFIKELEYEKIKPKTSIRKSIVGTNFFLNFNYTNVLKNVISDDYISFNKRKVCNIHGSTYSKNHEIIFGYGDEDSIKFKELLELNDNVFLENVKTFKYLSDNNYDKLNHFINSNSLYQVIIIGHSCQLSDKVLLNEIFTNKNCFSIKIYHYNGHKDYINKTMSISRVTEDQNYLRNIIFRFAGENTIPQSEK